MLKKMKLSIFSRIQNIDENGLPEGECERTDESSIATVRLADGEISISYKTLSEGAEIFTAYLLRGKELTVTRRGALNSTMVFSVGRTFNSVYEIPPYKFDMTVTAKRLSASVTEQGGNIDLLYEMTVGGASKLCRMDIRLTEAK